MAHAMPGPSTRKAAAVIILEQDPNHVSVYGKAQDSGAHAFYSAVVTLTLGVLGRWVENNGNADSVPIMSCPMHLAWGAC